MEGGAVMPKRLPKGCCEDTDRHGNIRIYYRAKGRPKIRLRATPWTPEFMQQYEAAKNSAPAPPIKNIKFNTWRWLVVEYFKSTDFLQLDPSTQHRRRKILEGTFDEPIRPESKNLFCDIPLERLNRNAIEVLRDRKFKTPESANNRLKAIKQVFKFAARKNIISSNPARDVERLKIRSSGYATWTMDDVAAFEARHPIGSRARLALALLLYTGARRSDVLTFGRQHVKNGKLIFTQQKTKKQLVLPILPQLQTILEASPVGSLTFLVNEFGRPYSAQGFSNLFRMWCRQAGLKNLSPHGLRKAAATLLANAGASSRMLMSVFGWSSLQEAERYTRAADQQQLAEQAMNLWCPTESESGTKTTKS
jgi:integrase